MPRPLIGLATGQNKEETYLMLNKGYMNALLHVGALPVALPLTDDPDVLAECLSQVDGLLLTGGGDIDPALFGEYTRPACGAIDPLRDAMEIPLARLAAETGKPTLAICRGLQVMNVALGGTLYQDIPSEFGTGTIAHNQKQPDRYPAHPVTCVPGSLLHKIAGCGTFNVNSLHHQAVRALADGFEGCAESPDGLVEAAWLPEHPFYLGVQWHPERLWQNDDISVKIFRAFAEACRIRP